MKLPKKLLFLLSLLLIVGAACRDNNNNATSTPDTPVGDANPSPDLNGNETNQTDPESGGGTNEGNEQNNSEAGTGSAETGLIARPAGYAPSEFVSLGEPMIVLLEGGTPYEVGDTIKHTVIEGEWLAQLARCYGVRYRTLLAANPGVVWPDFLLPGDIINVTNLGEAGPIIGTPCIHRPQVVANDTWQALAATYNVPIRELQRLNPGLLRIGTRLLIPATTSTPLGPTLANMDLWFILDGGLAKWQANSAELLMVQIPLSHILDIETNASGDWILAKIAHEDIIDIVLIDTISMQMKTLEAGIADRTRNSFFVRMVVGENGNYGAYLIRDDNGERLTTFEIANPENATFQMFEQIASQQTIGPREAEVTDYQNGAIATVAVSTSKGIFTVDYATGKLNAIYEIDSENRQDPSFFALESLSLNRRYFLAQGFAFEALAYFVIDMQTGMVIFVPNSSSFANWASVAWNSDGELTTLARNDQIEAIGLHEAVFQIVDNENGFTLNQLEERIIPLGESPIIEFGARVFLAPDNVALFPNFVTNVNAPGLWSTANDAGELQIALPPTAELSFVQWVPMGEGVLVWLDEGPLNGGELVYISAARNSSLALTSVLGTTIDDFHWTIPR